MSAPETDSALYSDEDESSTTFLAFSFARDILDAREVNASTKKSYVADDEPHDVSPPFPFPSYQELREIRADFDRKISADLADEIDRKQLTIAILDFMMQIVEYNRAAECDLKPRTFNHWQMLMKEWLDEIVEDHILPRLPEGHHLRSLIEPVVEPYPPVMADALECLRSIFGMEDVNTWWKYYKVSEIYEPLLRRDDLLDLINANAPPSGNEPHILSAYPPRDNSFPPNVLARLKEKAERSTVPVSDNDPPSGSSRSSKSDSDGSMPLSSSSPIITTPAISPAMSLFMAHDQTNLEAADIEETSTTARPGAAQMQMKEGDDKDEDKDEH